MKILVIGNGGREHALCKFIVKSQGCDELYCIPGSDSIKEIANCFEIDLMNNDTGKSNSEEFEVQVNNILNKATAESGEIGRKKLSKNNNFVTMVNAGSKGSDLNLSFVGILIKKLA